MNPFFKLNTHKLRFAFIFSSVTFSSLAIIGLSIGTYAKGHLPDIDQIIAILVFTIIIFPIFIIFVGYLSWLYKRSRRNKAFSKPPFNELEKIGFYKSFKDENSKWTFTEEVHEGEINGFKIRCDLPEEKPNSIEFEFLNVFREIDKTDFKRLDNLLANYNGYFKYETIAISYTFKQTKVLRLDDLRKDIQQFTMMLKEEGFIAIC